MNNPNATTMKLRPMTLADADLMASWDNSNAERQRDKLKRWLEDKDLECFTAEISAADGSSSHVIGHCHIDRQHLRWNIGWYIAPKFRKRGLGYRMAKLLVEKCKGAYVVADIEFGNEASVKIARSLGLSHMMTFGGIV